MVKISRLRLIRSFSFLPIQERRCRTSRKVCRLFSSASKRARKVFLLFINLHGLERLGFRHFEIGVEITSLKDRDLPLHVDKVSLYAGVWPYDASRLLMRRKTCSAIW